MVNGLGEPIVREKISRAQFDSVVALESIWFSPGPSMSLYYYDGGELFRGATIHITLDPNFAIESSGLET